jgi:hypothetical protein
MSLNEIKWKELNTQVLYNHQVRIAAQHRGITPRARIKFHHQLPLPTPLPTFFAADRNAF